MRGPRILSGCYLRALLGPLTAGALVLTSLLPALLPPVGEAAATPSGTLTDTSGPVSWQGQSFAASVVASPDDCDKTLPCDHFKLTVGIDPSFWSTHSGGVRVRIEWASLPNDFDLYVYDSAGNEVDHSGKGATDYAPGQTPYEELTIPNPSGTYDVTVVPFSVVNSGYSGKASLALSSSGSASGVVFNTSGSLAFAPATIVSAHFLGAEPQTTIERHVPGSPADAVDANRIFIDWPLSSRTAIGQLSRSLDGGDSFRLLIDPGCPERSRPNCATGGGGDTENEVNLFTGVALFSDQESVANEALASSTDHGDSFPLTRQEALTNLATATDRQWLTHVKPGTVSVAGQDIHALLAYHLPAAGQYVQGITQDGIAVPQPVPQIELVSQSGPIRMDNTDGPGHGWIYQSFRNGSGYQVATAYGPDYQSPSAWQVNHVADDQPAIFPWLSLDGHGNAYAVWVTGGVVYYSASNIDAPENNPSLGGRPGSVWLPKQRVSPIDVGSAVFPGVIAGDAGRIAVVYDGTTQFSGVSDDAPRNTPWNTYAAVITNALQISSAATITTGVVSHRPIHYGSICTSGTTCTGDRTLLDMIDVGVDEAGRVGIVFTDNNSALGMPEGVSGDARNGPFVHFAKQVAGPSLSAGSPLVAVDRTKGKQPKNGVTAPAGDATWPNRTGATNLPALDLRQVTLAGEKQALVAQVTLSNAALGQMAADLATYNAAWPLQPAQRLQYVVRFSTASDVYHLSAEYSPSGSLRFFGGKLDRNDGLTNGSTVLAAGYHADAGITVTGDVEGNVLTMRVDPAQLGLAQTFQVYSVTGFAMAGPNETAERTILNTMRTVDASAPFDAKITTRAVLPPPTPTPTPLTKAGLDVVATVAKPLNDSAVGTVIKPLQTVVATVVSGASSSAGTTIRQAGSTAEQTGEGTAGKTGQTVDKVAPGAGQVLDPDAVLKP